MWAALEPLHPKGTCSKGGRFFRKGGKGARRQGGGRKDHFEHLKLKVKSYLGRERSMCHHVDKVDLLTDCLDLCVAELTLATEALVDTHGEKQVETHSS